MSPAFPNLDHITIDEDNVIHLGPLVTHNHCVESRLIRARAYPLARAAWEVGAPQIRNRGTIAGNLITASPANDTITPLMALMPPSRCNPQRARAPLPLKDFYTGVRKTVMQPDEMLVDISFPAMEHNCTRDIHQTGLAPRPGHLHYRCGGHSGHRSGFRQIGLHHAGSRRPDDHLARRGSRKISRRANRSQTRSSKKPRA